MQLEDYGNFPDRVPVEAIYNLFKKTLLDFESNIICKDKFLDLLTQLMERQIMSYEILEEPLKSELDDELSKLWNTQSYHDVDIILSLVVNLGLETTFEKAKESLVRDEAMDAQLLEEIRETIAEVGDHISDPYFELR